MTVTAYKEEKWFNDFKLSFKNFLSIFFVFEGKDV